MNVGAYKLQVRFKEDGTEIQLASFRAQNPFEQRNVDLPEDLVGTALRGT